METSGQYTGRKSNFDAATSIIRTAHGMIMSAKSGHPSGSRHKVTFSEDREQKLLEAALLLEGSLALLESK